MTEIQFFLEGIGNRNVATDYSSPNFITDESSIEKASKEFAKKNKLKYIEYEILNSGYRVYYLKPSLLKSKRKPYIYYAKRNA
ncbi:hypothetical protein [Metabacillus indicus]|uniref:Uncharacterized protein n=2 Tax=Metabacillus TaxID=2675233 RepID=A0A084GWI0_METID|nr:hypothetical protein [Metabacillus indicus]KEZ51004.1 hypothetical protein AZ46_0210330 [Metabacillus indicus LMG 22858]KEZ51692.1 hypothetical protein GS18_0211245 [Metabacillus indicus]MDX8291138.1 hypothetical protein [Metabacillus indicus]